MVGLLPWVDSYVNDILVLCAKIQHDHPQMMTYNLIHDEWCTFSLLSLSSDFQIEERLYAGSLKHGRLKTSPKASHEGTKKTQKEMA